MQLFIRQVLEQQPKLFSWAIYQLRRVTATISARDARKNGIRRVATSPTGRFRSQAGLISRSLHDALLDKDIFASHPIEAEVSIKELL